MTVWFTSDTHFFHKNIISFSNRPYKDVGEMNWDIIRNISSVVAPGDTLYHLGDFTMGSWNVTLPLIHHIPCPIYWILGNHDRPKNRDKEHFAWVGHYKRIDVEGQKICLCHYPIESWHGMHRGAWHLHGHSHGNGKRTMNRRFDVGVDVWNMKPVSFEMLKAHPRMNASPDPVDHHE